jgi:hypothetical protein
MPRGVRRGNMGGMDPEESHEIETHGVGGSVEDSLLNEVPESITVGPQSVLYFSYPFAFDRKNFSAIAASVAGGTSHSDGKVENQSSIWELTDVSSVRQYMLPHLADQLNVRSRASEQGASGAQASDEPVLPGTFLWRLSPEALAALQSGMPFRDTNSIENVGTSPSWVLHMPGSRRTPLSLLNVRLALFSTGAGSITIAIKPEVDTLRAWLDCNYFMAKRRHATLRLVSNEEDVTRIELMDLFATLLSSRHSLSYVEPTIDAPWWEEVFVPRQCFPFPTLFINQDVGETGLGSITTRFRYGFSGTQHIDPARWQLSDDAGEIFHYSERSVFVFSIDAAGFVAAGTPDTEFWKRTLPDHLGGTYLLAVLVVLAQRSTLVKISKAVAQSWDLRNTPDAHRRVCKSIVSDLLEFTARLQFTQIFQTEHYHACYLHLRKAFHLEELNQEVQDEITQMSAILDHEAEERRNDLTLLQTSLLGALLAGLSARGSLNVVLRLPTILNLAIIFSVMSVVLTLPLLIMHRREGYGKVDQAAAGLCGAALLWLGTGILLWKTPIHSATAWSVFAVIPGAALGYFITVARNGDRARRTGNSQGSP